MTHSITEAQKDVVKLRINEILTDTAHIVGKEQVIYSCVEALRDFVSVGNSGELSALDDALFDAFGVDI